MLNIYKETLMQVTDSIFAYAQRIFNKYRFKNFVKVYLLHRCLEPAFSVIKFLSIR